MKHGNQGSISPRPSDLAVVVSRHVCHSMRPSLAVSVFRCLLLFFSFFFLALLSLAEATERWLAPVELLAWRAPSRFRLVYFLPGSAVPGSMTTARCCEYPPHPPLAPHRFLFSVRLFLVGARCVRRAHRWGNRRDPPDGEMICADCGRTREGSVVAVGQNSALPVGARALVFCLAGTGRCRRKKESTSHRSSNGNVGITFGCVAARRSAGFRRRCCGWPIAFVASLSLAYERL